MMNDRARGLFYRSGFAFTIALAMGTQVYAQQVVGAVGATNSAPTGRAPKQAVRVLEPGGSIFFKDRIVTKSGGSAHLTFLDRSTLNVGEKSDVLIDEFIYRPDQAIGAMSATLTKGVLRFVGGQISHEGGTTIKTPVVTIGIRGGIATVGYFGKTESAQDIAGVPEGFHGGAVVVNGFGVITVRNSVSEVTISRPGFGVFIGTAGERIAAPIRVDLALLQRMSATVTSRTGQTGGAPRSIAAATATTVRPLTIEIPMAIPQRPSLNALDFASTISLGSALARNRSNAQKSGQLQQQVLSATKSTVPVITAPAAPVSVTAAPAGPQLMTPASAATALETPVPATSVSVATTTASQQTSSTSTTATVVTNAPGATAATATAAVSTPVVSTPAVTTPALTIPAATTKAVVSTAVATVTATTTAAATKAVSTVAATTAAVTTTPAKITTIKNPGDQGKNNQNQQGQNDGSGDSEKD